MKNADFRNGASDFQTENRNRQFLTYGDEQIGQKASDRFKNPQSVSTGRELSFSWSRYCKFMRA